MIEKLTVAVWSLLTLLVLGFLTLLLVVGLSRIGYPYELEWMEGGSLQNVQRVVGGESIYVEPSIDFVPFLYTPLYYYLAAPLLWLLGNGFIALRLLSLLATLATLLLIHRVIRGEGGSHRSGLIAAGIYAACFELGGAWLDIGRVDSLMVALLLAGLLLLRHATTSRQAILAGAILALGFFTKQTVLVAVAPVLAWQLLSRRRLGLACLGSFAGLLVISTLLMNQLSSGWYSYYVFELPRQHAIAHEYLLGFWWLDLLRPLPIMVLMTAAGVGLLWRDTDHEERNYRSGFFLALLGGCLAASWFSRLHSGGYDNVLLPAYLAVALLGGICIAIAERDSCSWRWTVPAGACLQLAMLIYLPAKHVPSQQDRQDGDQIVQRLRDAEGEVLVPYHGYLAVMAGKRGSAHQMAVDDVRRGTDPARWEKLKAQFVTAISEQRYSLILMTVENWFRDEVTSSYHPASPLFEGDDNTNFQPVAGKPPHRPRWIYLPTR
jgi:hypothetical protein